ncbi:hypothetical protein PTKIN_Ptkin18bG0083800 [Pterospermum kingtungense]
MVLKLRTPFKQEAGDTDQEGNKNKPVYASSTNCSPPSPLVVGLRILTQISQAKSNVVVVKPAFKIILPSSKTHHGSSGHSPAPVDHHYSCFLKSCHLCHKNLSLDKEVYMYRGDQGFCSIECRDRQMVLDEMKELEQILASSRHCSASGRRETGYLLEDLGRRNKSPHQNRKHWAIVS